MSKELLSRGILAGSFLKSLDVPTLARELRKGDAVPGMLSYAESAMLQQLVSRTWRGDGAIIDGGSFFGSSLVALSEGMHAGSVLPEIPSSKFPGGRPIHGYELGYLPAPKNENADRRRVFHGVEYFMGDNFIPILEKTIAPYRDLIDLHVGDLLDERWPEAPIEIAFIDVCKTIRLNAHVTQQFFPALVPGESTMVNQDFFFDRLPWIKVTMGYLSDYFSWEGQVMSSSVYRSIKPVPTDVAAVDPFREGTYDECLELHDSVEFPGLEREFVFKMDLSRAYLMVLKGRKDEALDAVRLVASSYDDLLGDDDKPRGFQFRLDRAERQISNGNIFKVA